MPCPRAWDISAASSAGRSAGSFSIAVLQDKGALQIQCDIAQSDANPVSLSATFLLHHPELFAAHTEVPLSPALALAESARARISSNGKRNTGNSCRSASSSLGWRPLALHGICFAPAARGRALHKRLSRWQRVSRWRAWLWPHAIEIPRSPHDLSQYLPEPGRPPSVWRWEYHLLFSGSRLLPDNPVVPTPAHPLPALCPRLRLKRWPVPGIATIRAQ